MKYEIFGTITGLALILCACHALPESVSAVPSGRDDLMAPRKPAAAQASDPAVPVLAGAVRTIDEPLRPIEGAPSGRVWLLEMYQSAVEQRDESARRATDMARERDGALAQAAEQARARADLEVRNASLVTALQELQTKALELARRLAEAEIARLEAEKTALAGVSIGTGGGKP